MRLTLLSVLITLAAPFAAKAGCDLSVDRVYDFSERVVLINKTDKFWFEHCKRDKCQKITHELPRGVSMEELRQYLGPGLKDLRKDGWDNLQMLTDATSNYARAPKGFYDIRVFGYSTSPDRFNVWCSGQEHQKQIELFNSAKSDNDFLIKYKGACNKFCQSGTPVVPIANVIQGVKHLEQEYMKARGAIVSQAQEDEGE